VAALAGEHFQTADLLRHNGADLDVRGLFGRNALYGAAYSGNLEVVRILIGDDPVHVNARDVNGATPLHFASTGHKCKDCFVPQLLLEHGADVNAQDHNDWTPLYTASLNGVLKFVRLLLEHGADVEAKSNNGKTALEIAADYRS
jgi:ankyrin repeat protein